MLPFKATGLRSPVMQLNSLPISFIIVAEQYNEIPNVGILYFLRVSQYICDTSFTMREYIAKIDMAIALS